ncbi:hypothetical protein [Pedobacter aquatilis]|uniref:hypothetical protein n=1 Tax=Pedobacter aquatilis TaxID=351343 RepID=UPI00292E8CDE|nr:hypothetical protein [Pedobacter aquatilis]
MANIYPFIPGINTQAENPENKATIWVYEYGAPDSSQTAIIGVLNLEDMENKSLLKAIHAPSSNPNQKQSHNGSSPALCAFYPSTEIISQLGSIKLTKEDIQSFDNYQGRQRLWRIQDENQIADLSQAFSRIGYAYILSEIDTTAYNQKGFLPAMCVPYYDLEMQSCHIRLSFSPEEQRDELLESLSQQYSFGQMSGPYRPIKEGHIGFSMDGLWFELVSKDWQNHPTSIPDQQQILSKLNCRTEKATTYFDNQWIALLSDLAKNEQDIAFSFSAPDRYQIMAAASAGREINSEWFKFLPAFPEKVFSEQFKSEQYKDVIK